MRSARVLALCLTVAGAAACDGAVGEDDPGPLADRLCSAPLTLTGSFTSSITPPPTAAVGCVPEGTWTINLVAPTNGDCSSVDFLPSYTVEIVDIAPAGADRPDHKVTITNAPAGAEVNAAINASGNGACNLSVELITTAGTQFKVLALHAYVDPSDSATRPVMAGPDNAYELWKAHP